VTKEQMITRLEAIVASSVIGRVFPGLKICGPCGQGVDQHAHGLYPHQSGCIVEKLALLIEEAKKP